MAGNGVLDVSSPCPYCPPAHCLGLGIPLLHQRCSRGLFPQEKEKLELLQVRGWGFVTVQLLLVLVEKHQGSARTPLGRGCGVDTGPLCLSFPIFPSLPRGSDCGVQEGSTDSSYTSKIKQKLKPQKH